MVFSTPSAAQNGQQPVGVWTTLAPYVAPPLAASGAIVVIFRQLMEKATNKRDNLF